jgi:hypothetical protein
MPVVYLIVDTPNHERAVQEGHQPTQMSAYRLEYEGDDKDAVAAEFAAGFPPGTRFGLVNPSAVHAHRLAPRFEKHDLKPGETQ